MTVIEYCAEEVRRQGHDINRLDGIQRVGWMLRAWCYALAFSDRPITLERVATVGTFTEPAVNVAGLRTCEVRIGWESRGAPAEDVIPRLTRLLALQHRVTPMEFYKEYELIHPFADGNGRSGKVLLNWLNGTLLDPIFPPNDLFGSPIINP